MNAHFLSLSRPTAFDPLRPFACHATNAPMKLVTLAKLRQSKTVIVGLCIIIVAAVLLAWWTISHWGQPPVHTTTQALFLSCDDSGTSGDDCNPYRVGGTVVAAPVRSNLGIADFEFAITDGCMNWSVYSHSDAASLAHLNAGDFVVVEGGTGVDGNFHSAQIFVGSEAARLGRDLPQLDTILDRYDVPREACLEIQESDARDRSGDAMGRAAR